MEPQLISRKAIKKILKKKYFSDDNSFNKSFNSIIETVKINWLPIVIILVAFALLIHLYIENKNKKEALKNLEREEKELEKLQKKNKERFEDYEDYKPKANYESEYYKMLPRVTNNPDVIPYQY
jgi:ATP-dependent Zn protease